MEVSVIEHPNVIVALAYARADIGTIGKGRQVTAGPARYAYRGIEDILNAANPVLARHGITVCPVVDEWQRDPIDKGSTSSWHRTSAVVHFDVYGPGGIDDRIRGSVISDADDNGDKGAGKLHSYALKTFLIELLTIPTEDVLEDNEATTAPATTAPAKRKTKRKPVSEDDLAKVVDAARQLDDDGREALKVWLHEREFTLASTDGITASGLVAAAKQIELLSPTAA